MNAEFIKPFIASFINVLLTMAQTELKPGEALEKVDSKACGDVSGLIGMIGDDIKGSLSITFEESLALDIMNKMLGEKPTSVDDDVQDMVGEVVNMVCGGAKSTLAETSQEFGMATPIVVFGKNHTINHQVDGAKLVMPFTSEAGKAYLEICFNK
ncbi:chemotaxis protein CheX [Aliiglaciecola sp. 2_MG-2023]|uniref:chemotaxis protein CheX n=1 Tax=Alteromonadaceae TaxID=72275 RepID=UPI0026E26A2B|nr:MULTISPECIES: chemotaxis protein CheX [unclassified Aliiglaciecola]MDO6713341.1 chemotaxis protein CheX [Aliiglaciecola sp. 2_MG-2023]MDO6753663.1 chemotaxis protein CheX [Aliiglaciecola sp. 1_MG-2023]